jgi:serine/threonine protein kinase
MLDADGDPLYPFDEEYSMDKSEVYNEANITRLAMNHCDLYIVCYVDFLEDDDSYYILTEFLGDYIPLNKYIGDLSQKSSPEQKWILIINMLKGLHLIHSLGITHRDIGINNIMIDPKNMNIKYIDFGFACLDCPTNSQHIGTIIPPELNLKHTITKEEWYAVDYWALGNIISSILLNAYHDGQNPTSLIGYISQKLGPTHRDDLNKILASLLQINPKMRTLFIPE